MSSRLIKNLIYIAIILVTLLCICIGSVTIPIGETISILFKALKGEQQSGAMQSILLNVRMPRVFCVALVGASLSFCGCVMQGLLRNPLAEGSTLGVSSGASLGAVTAIMFNINIPFLPLASTTVLAIIFAFISLILILSLAYRLDKSMATNTVILIGIVFSMLTNSLLSLIIAFSGQKLRSITFWTMGSLAGSDYNQVLLMLVVLIVSMLIILPKGDELNAFSLGEENAHSIGVNVQRERLIMLAVISLLIGTSVAIGGVIGFVGLIIPHISRLLIGSNHKKLMPLTLANGAIFLMLCDLFARTVLRPTELPIGVISSLIGAITFIYIYSKNRRKV